MLPYDPTECYVDDLVIKSRQRIDHLEYLKAIFDKLLQHQLKMNLLKCASGVTSGKFLGFVVFHRGIEVDPSKIKVVIELPPLRAYGSSEAFMIILLIYIGLYRTYPGGANHSLNS